MLLFDDVTMDLKALYDSKNSDYGGSFDDLLSEFGLIAVVIRLQDKTNRLKAIAKNDGECSVKDETIRDTLMDLANYSIMTLMRL